MMLSRIVIVEDDENTLKGMQKLLTQEGYCVHGMSNSQMAFDAIDAQPFDIVLCDYRLPDIDGLELCCQLKRLQPNLTLFLMTAFSEEELVYKSKNCGVEKIFSKPIALDELFETLADTSALLRISKRYEEDLEIVEIIP